MNKTKRISKILIGLLAVMLLLSNISTIFATYSDKNSITYSPYEFTKNPDGKTEGGAINTEDTREIKDIGGKIVGIIRVVGTMVAVGMIIVLGIKYMMGSAEERAEYKKTMFPYFIGAILIFGASTLAQMVYTWASKI